MKDIAFHTGSGILRILSVDESTITDVLERWEEGLIIKIETEDGDIAYVNSKHCAAVNVSNSGAKSKPPWNAFLPGM